MKAVRVYFVAFQSERAAVFDVGKRGKKKSNNLVVKHVLDLRRLFRMEINQEEMIFIIQNCPNTHFVLYCIDDCEIIH